jgi:hypothetical protein
VLAPGDGEAEPGVTSTKFQRACNRANSVNPSPARFICRPLRGLGSYWVRFPRLGFVIAWSYYSSRQLRRLVESVRINSPLRNSEHKGTQSKAEISHYLRQLKTLRDRVILYYLKIELSWSLGATNF